MQIEWWLTDQRTGEKKKKTHHFRRGRLVDVRSGRGRFTLEAHPLCVLAIWRHFGAFLFNAIGSRRARLGETRSRSQRSRRCFERDDCLLFATAAAAAVVVILCVFRVGVGRRFRFVSCQVGLRRQTATTKHSVKMQMIICWRARSNLHYYYYYSPLWWWWCRWRLWC